MSITTVSSRTFNQDTSRVKKAAADGPVFITDRGRPSYVLLTINDYERLQMNELNIVEMLAMPVGGDIKFDPPRMGEDWVRPADLD